MTTRFKNIIKRPVGSFVRDAFTKKELSQLGIILKGGLYILPYQFKNITMKEDGRVVTLQPCNLMKGVYKTGVCEGFRIINKTITIVE